MAAVNLFKRSPHLKFDERANDARSKLMYRIAIMTEQLFNKEVKSWSYSCARNDVVTLTVNLKYSRSAVRWSIDFGRRKPLIKIIGKSC